MPLELGCTWLCFLKKLLVGLCLHLTASQWSSAGFREKSRVEFPRPSAAEAACERCRRPIHTL